MTIRYKNQGFKQASTGKTTVLTCPTSATIIVKSMYVANNDASSAILVNMNLVDSSDSSAEYEFFRDDVPAKSQVNATPEGLNLEAGDAITVTAASGSNKIQGAITYAQLDRSQENG
jgi:methionine-rich copper-binding protein CopC|tara:strand:+ start:2488 stop:2838 length:351 start_codon:yes stop_codon:yes gene_type:complete